MGNRIGNGGSAFFSDEILIPTPEIQQDQSEDAENVQTASHKVAYILNVGLLL